MYVPARLFLEAEPLVPIECGDGVRPGTGLGTMGKREEYF